MARDVQHVSSHHPTDSQANDQEIDAMLKKAGLPHLLGALDYEREKRDHQRHEVLERSRGIENICSHMFMAQQVKSDECRTRQ